MQLVSMLLFDSLSSLSEKYLTKLKLLSESRHLITSLNWFGLSPVVLLHSGVWDVQAGRTTASVRSWTTLVHCWAEARSHSHRQDQKVRPRGDSAWGVHHHGLPEPLLLHRFVPGGHWEDEVSTNVLLEEFYNNKYFVVCPWIVERMLNTCKQAETLLFGLLLGSVY